MKVIFKYSKSLGNSVKDDEVEMFDSTAAVLQRKGFGKITKKVVKLEKTVNGMKKTLADLTEEDTVALKLKESLVKK